MYGKKLKDLNTKVFVKSEKKNFYKISDISSQKEFSYKKIEIDKPQKFNLNYKNFYIYIDKGNLSINQNNYKETNLIYSKNKISIQNNYRVIFYIFFFRKVSKINLLRSKKLFISKIKKKKIKVKKKILGKNC